MHVTRIFTGTDGESHFEDLDIPLKDLGSIGAMSKLIEATGVVFRETGPEYDLDWHNAPRRQFVVMLSGGPVEIEVGDGSTRRFGPGDVLLAEDVEGEGHRVRVLGPEARVALSLAIAP